MKVSLHFSPALALLAATMVPGLVAVASAAEGADAPPAVLLEAGYAGDLWRNTHGGIAVGDSYLDNLDLMATVDGERTAGIEGLTLHAHIMYNNGHAFSERWVGDAQVISNIEGVDTWRLYEFWGELKFGAAGATSLRAGLYDLNSEFDSIDTAGLFINSSHGIGPEIAQTGQNGPSIFPVTSLGVRVRHESDTGYLQFVALDAVPGERRHPDRTGFSLGSGEGTLLVAELGTTRGRFSKLALGGWAYTADFEAIGELDGSGAPVSDSGNRGIYAIAEARLHTAGSVQVSGWLRAGVAAQRFNAFDAYVGAGIAAAGLVPRRPDDQLGVAIASAQAADPWRAQQSLAGSATTARETTLELTWRMPLSDWFTLQPDVQYVIHPGASADLRDALTFGLRFEIAMSRDF